MEKKMIIGVIGAGAADERTFNSAETIGRLIAKRDATLICAGLGGVMEAAAQGAKTEVGTTNGILPQSEKAS